jgi:hypothetical protein
VRAFCVDSGLLSGDGVTRVGEHGQLVWPCPQRS